MTKSDRTDYRHGEAQADIAANLFGERLGTPEVGYALQTLTEELAKVVASVIAFDDRPHQRLERHALVVSYPARDSCFLLSQGRQPNSVGWSCLNHDRSEC
jgi:hypothetical protein